MSQTKAPPMPDAKSGDSKLMNRFLNSIEKAGNKLPDPTLLFAYALFIVWGLSALMSQVNLDLVHPATGEAVVVNNLLTGSALATFLASSNSRNN